MSLSKVHLSSSYNIPMVIVLQITRNTAGITTERDAGVHIKLVRVDVFRAFIVDAHTTGK
jgi:hypothetical protein